MTKRPTSDAAWTQLSSDLSRFIRRRVSDPYIADDLLQETFLRIHRSIRSLNEADRLAAWVYQIARNVIHDHYRNGAGNDRPLAPEIFAQERTTLLRRRAAEWLEEMLPQLPEKYRKAVELAEIDGLPQRKVAERLGLSLSGAKSRIQRGRALLKQALENCCRFEFDRRGNLVDYEPKPKRTACKDCP